MNDSRQTTGAVAVPRQSADSPTPRTSAPGARDAFFDNAKFVAIVLVAAGHAWEPLRGDSRGLTALYMLVYAFHMPAFIIIAGYFSRSFDGSPRRVARLVTGVLLPYVVFQVAYTYWDRWLDGSDRRDLPMFDPKWLMWFLLALFIWRLTVPVWQALRWPLPVALVLAAAACATPSLGGDLQIQRVIQFLPFFVLGLRLRKEHFALVRHRAMRIAAVPVLVVALAVAYWAVPRVSYQWLYHRESAEDLGESWQFGVGMTLLVFVCSLVVTACFLALVPGRRTWFSALGAGTLYGYLLHGFIVLGSRAAGWYEPEVMRDVHTAVPILTVASALCITLLCTPPVQRVFRPVMEPTMPWFFRRPPAVGTGTHPPQGRQA
ncbi:acyltransferase family protein [Streptomyces sp. RFCAC02]|uniref:acyltransferase family protein n=1 Tax=Streptomyces sp. RFCAC02 TaxID=2499143 RepID=UPI0019D10E40|nr:acyltransferase family protein [Streptomyces sp. RFCAC02]